MKPDRNDLKMVVLMEYCLSLTDAIKMITNLLILYRSDSDTIFKNVTRYKIYYYGFSFPIHLVLFHLVPFRALDRGNLCYVLSPTEIVGSQ